METSFLPAWKDGYEPALSPAGELSGEGHSWATEATPGCSWAIGAGATMESSARLAFLGPVSGQRGDDELELAR